QAYATKHRPRRRPPNCHGQGDPVGHKTRPRLSFRSQADRRSPPSRIRIPPGQRARHRNASSPEKGQRAATTSIPASKLHARYSSLQGGLTQTCPSRRSELRLAARTALRSPQALLSPPLLLGPDLEDEHGDSRASTNDDADPSLAIAISAAPGPSA